MRWRGLVTAGMAAVITTPVAAGVLDAHFGDSPTCYARSYDTAHLASHPRQRVREVMLSNVEVEADEDTDAWDVALEFGFTLTNGKSYLATAYCVEDVCGLEGDGGRLAVRAAPDDGLRLSVVGDFLELEGVDDFSGNLVESDDTVFLVYPVSPNGCVAR